MFVDDRRAIGEDPLEFDQGACESGERPAEAQGVLGVSSIVEADQAECVWTPLNAVVMLGGCTRPCRCGRGPLPPVTKRGDCCGGAEGGGGGGGRGRWTSSGLIVDRETAGQCSQDSGYRRRCSQSRRCRRCRCCDVRWSRSIRSAGRFNKSYKKRGIRALSPRSRYS
jgi:hypothetical protein